jgi:nucleotide-binding universal stress UspA family protein
VEIGDLDEEIASEAEKQKADLIVLSVRKRTRIARFLKSDISEKVTRKAPCPVLTIRLAQNEPELRAA